MQNPIKKIIIIVSQKIRLIREIKKVKNTLISIHQYLSKRDVHLLYVMLPDKRKIKGLTPFELERINNWSFDFNKYKEELPKLRKIYGENVSKEYILSIFDGGVVVQGHKRKILLDYISENQHIINGRRITVDQPKTYHNSIYTHGACTWRGTGVEDKDTIASLLQKQINKSFPNNYKIVNSAIGRGSTIFDDFEYIKEQNYKAGDIVILGSHGAASFLSESFFNKQQIHYIETSSLFNRPHNYGEWFNDSVLHTNKRGNKIIAEKIYQTLKSLNLIKKIEDEDRLEQSTPQTYIGKFITKGQRVYGDNFELLKFIESIKEYKRGDDYSKNGSIVMNCNPFTLGHRYLIEYAASQVDTLYIFVVEENKSFFPFEDRYDLVKKGTADIPNVIVLPSGNFIISAVTFPGYFYKDNLKETKIDCSNDLTVFAEYIAPALNIKVRFAGEEPLDPITKQYNEGMAEILPQHGMEFCEIPRKEDSEGIGVISASRVRSLLKVKDFEGIKHLVPQTTYDYLLRFNNDTNQK